MRANINLDGLPTDILLEDWTWLVKGSHSPIAMNNFGDVFLKSAQEEIKFLDTAWGKLEPVARFLGEFQSLTADGENKRRWFQLDLLTALEHAGFRLEKGQCFAFKTPLVLGGKAEATNVEIAPITVHLSLMGQMHQQLKNFPPGTKIRGFSIK